MSCDGITRREFLQGAALAGAGLILPRQILPFGSVPAQIAAERLEQFGYADFRLHSELHEEQLTVKIADFRCGRGTVPRRAIQQHEKELIKRTVPAIWFGERENLCQWCLMPKDCNVFLLVELVGIEPTTSSLRTMRSPSFSSLKTNHIQ